MKAGDIVYFWMAAGPERWFTKDAAFDSAVTQQFTLARQQALAGAYDDWTEIPEGAVGLVILLDQMSRNMHRHSADAFAGDAKALTIANHSIAKGDHFVLPARLAQWLIMPLEHAEDLESQRRCIALFELLNLPEMVKYARIHHDIIARFGRFPHRNAVLGRVSTAEETAFLAEGGFAG